MLDLDWFGAMRRAVEAHRALFDEEPTIAGRTEYEGVGEGGDHALVLDRRCEDAVFAELETPPLRIRRRLRGGLRGARRGRRSATADSGWRVVVDPIDGSMNVRRTLPSHSLSVAIASGPSMADVELGYVYEFGAREEFTARRGEGAWLGEQKARARGRGLRARGRRPRVRRPGADRSRRRGAGGHAPIGCA